MATWRSPAVARSTISNTLSAFPGQVFSYGDNSIEENTSPSAPAGITARG